MALYVILTISLRQMGSAESKKLEKTEEVDRDPLPHADAPWPVKRGGLILKLYSNSLSIVFGFPFLVSWCLHFYGSWKDHNVEQVLSGVPTDSELDYLGPANFWFETFQNWQSEFPLSHLLSS